MDKLKKQIKEAKEAKKLLKKESASQQNVGLFDGTVVTYPDKKKPSSSDRAEEDEELFVVKKDGQQAVLGTTDREIDDPDSNKISNSKKAKKLKISIDGEAKLGKEEPKRKKILFDEDGRTVDEGTELGSGLGSLFSKSGKRDDESMSINERERLRRIEEHAKKLKDLVDQGRKEVNNKLETDFELDWIDGGFL